jgi:hypothetical protein
MAKVKFVSDEKAEKFNADVASLKAYVMKSPNSTFLRTLQIILNDNVRMYNAIKEYENGKPNGPQGPEQTTSQP